MPADTLYPAGVLQGPYGSVSHGVEMRNACSRVTGICEYITRGLNGKTKEERGDVGRG